MQERSEERGEGKKGSTPYYHYHHYEGDRGHLTKDEDYVEDSGDSKENDEK